MTRNRVLAALGLLLLAWGLWYFFPSRERQVRRQMNALAQWASKEPGEGALAAVQTARAARDFFADPCEWQADAFDLSGQVSPDEIARYEFAVRSRFETLRVKLYDLSVDFSQDGAAHVTATVRIEGSRKDEDSLNETHEVRGTLAKQDGKWLLQKATVVEVLRR